MKVHRISIDVRLDLHDFHLHGDNEKILTGLDLSQYDVIDLDAYGIPFAQLQIIFDGGYTGVVFVTAIQTMMGRLPNDMLVALGFNDAMIEKAPTLMGRRGFQYLLEWLSMRGVTSLKHRTKHRKHYLTFKINDADSV